VSAANRARPQQAAGRILVQVGSFAVPANADAARGRLAAMGLPVQAARATIRGKPVQVVFAGPFATAAEAKQAVAAARSAGFADAFIR
jgi:cell division protein FtsN